jgi:hypothetical protein
LMPLPRRNAGLRLAAQPARQAPIVTSPCRPALVMRLARGLAASGASPSRKACPCLVAISRSIHTTPPPSPGTPTVCVTHRQPRSCSSGPSSLAASSGLPSVGSTLSVGSSLTSPLRLVGSSWKLTEGTMRRGRTPTRPGTKSSVASGGGWCAFRQRSSRVMCKRRLLSFGRHSPDAARTLPRRWSYCQQSMPAIHAGDR